MMSRGGTAVAVYPDDGVVVAVMANLGQAKLPFRPFINVVPSDVTPSGILISPQWAWEDLNFQHTAHFNRAVLSRAPRKARGRGPTSRLSGA